MALSCLKEQGYGLMTLGLTRLSSYQWFDLEAFFNVFILAEDEERKMTGELWCAKMYNL